MDSFHFNPDPFREIVDPDPKEIPSLFLYFFDRNTSTLGLFCLLFMSLLLMYIKQKSG